MAVQGFGRPVALKGARYERNLFSGSSMMSFTPDTADMRRIKIINDSNLKQPILGCRAEKYVLHWTHNVTQATISLLNEIR
ncbi:MAG: hypothetical protein A2W09_04545 [Deltaproteobacteria bacterium RBG_16_50_11]|nr:MAG: hypothetical protein A2W09_04545 [Deltaproteobacteria bacterium RBG_16_50_11]